MIYGVVADVHSNLEAFEAVLSALERRGVEGILFLGDIVGYAADAVRCVERLMALAGHTVRGNHDRIVADARQSGAYAYSSDEVRDADDANRMDLDAAGMGYVRALRAGPVSAGDGVVLCHGSPRDEDEYLFDRGALEASGLFLRQRHPDAAVCFFGHTHAPLVVRDGRSVVEADPRGATLEEGSVYFVNPGSVGQPRDGDPRASFGVYDTERREYAHHRVDYDIGRAQRKIVERGLPRRFADRLRRGR